MRFDQTDNLSSDPIHGYIPFVSDRGLPSGEASERQLVDHPWLQRLRQIHQLQTAWWVFPAAEHTRFQHVLGAMHLASRAVAATYDSLREVCPDVPSRGYVECLMRLAALLHDVGHGPFGHFFDRHFLADFGHTHETLGGLIVRRDLAELVSRVRRNPHSRLVDDERLDPEQIVYLIARPTGPESAGAPRWLTLLRSWFCGIYTVDNLDFVLRDAFMAGYSTRAFDLDRLLHYSFFTPQGLTIHSRGMPALVRFMTARADLFRTIYFHRTVRAIDLALADLFAQSKRFLFAGNPAENLDAYRRLTEFSLLVDVARWPQAADAQQRELGQRWERLVNREIPWKMAAQRYLVFAAGAAEATSIFSQGQYVEERLRQRLPAALAALPLRVDLARHIHRPHTKGPSDGQNFLYDADRDATVPLTDDQLYRQLPHSHRILRVYAHDERHAAEISTALDALIGPGASDDVTNM